MLTTTQYGWKFDHSYAGLPPAFYRGQAPIKVKAPDMVVFNHALAESLGLNSALLSEDADIFSGNQLPDQALPIAQAYAGHQFGGFNMLGDGRAILLGEQLAPDGKRYDIQLKGSGATPYSRRGDGRAALGPMLREYLISEAMHALGVPTTRSLAVVSTGEPVYREVVLPGAVLTRVAASHLRVGTFQYAAALDELPLLKTLADYTIQRHYPEAAQAENPYLALLQTVISRQASLVAQWMHIGFIHGVINTDNMAISGETIDYGPCAFMDHYDPATVFSSIDSQGRYAYGNQPPIAQWNLARFAETLLPLIHSNPQEAIPQAEEAVYGFQQQYEQTWLDGMRRKLGLVEPQADDLSLVQNLLALMKAYAMDYTNTFRSLAESHSLHESAEDVQAWLQQWESRVRNQQVDPDSMRNEMLAANPAVIPRNHLVEEALLAAVRDKNMKPFDQLLAVLAHPFTLPDDEKYRSPSPDAGQGYRTFCGT